MGRPWRRRLFAIPQNKDLKRLVRARMAETGENYTQALSAVLDTTEPAGFGTLMQSFSASRYTGRRVRFAAVIRTHEAGGWAGLWLRVGTASGRDQFDNMQDRALSQTTDWQEAAVGDSLAGWAGLSAGAFGFEAGSRRCELLRR